MRYQSLDLDALILTAQKPSRYVGGEVNSIHKDLRAAKVTWALCFPDTYEVGMSNVGFRVLYHVLNARPDLACERSFMPWPDMAGLLRARKLPLFSMESRAPLRDFDVLGFSLQFEAAYTTVLEMLDLSGIPVLSADRKEGDPLVLAGGPCAYNGEPVAPFFDAMVIGEGEEVVGELSDVVADWKRAGGSRRELLERLARIPGVYVPSFFRAEYAADGTLAAVVPLLPGYERVSRRVVADLNLAPQPDRPIVPFMQAVHDRLPLELQRGCTRGCRFCQVGMLTRPTRQREPGRILKAAADGLAASGWEEVGFLSLSAGDYGCINSLLEAFFDRFAPERIAISLPSLRTETMTDRLAQQIAKVKKTGFTIAPEAATDRLRRVINKGNSEENLLKAAESVFRAGWSLLKLYFMIGLPTETDEDVLAIADLAKKVQRLARGIRQEAAITLSVSTFVPKPFTPFQWEPMLTTEETFRKHDLLRGAIPRKGSLVYRYHEARSTRVEAALARGDRRMATAVLAAWRAGQILDGWTEHFDPARWDTAFAAMEKEHGVGAAFMANRERSEGELLPWDHVDGGVEKRFLLKERARSRNGETIADCALEKCTACGACDFKLTEPRVYRPEDWTPPAPAEPAGPAPRAEGEAAQIDVKDAAAAAQAPEGEPAADSGSAPGETAPGAEQPKPRKAPHKRRPAVRVRFSKTGRSIAVSHLETMTMLTRALRRSALPVSYGEGYNPRPRVSFGPACPVGVESLAEFIDVEFEREVQGEQVARALAPQMPLGFEILGAEVLPPSRPSLAAAIAGMEYVARFPAEIDDGALAGAVEAFRAAESLSVLRQKPPKNPGRGPGGGKAKVVDLKAAVLAIAHAGEREVRFTLRMDDAGSAKPTEVVRQLLGRDCPEVRLKKAAVVFHPAEPASPAA